MSDERADRSARVRSTLAAMDDPRRSEEFVGAFAIDGRFRLGNVAAVVGHDAIRADVRGLFQAIRRMHHELAATWTIDDTSFAEGEVDYWPDGTEDTHVRLPMLARVRWEGGRIKDLHVFMDRSASHPFRGQPESLADPRR